MKRPLLINGAFLSKPYSGQGVYSKHMLENLMQMYEGEIHLCLFDKIDQKLYSKVSKHITVHHYKTYFPLPYSIRLLWWEMVSVARLRRHLNAVYWSPFMHPMMGAMCEVAMTLHDTFQFERPEYKTKLTRKIYNKLIAFTLKKPLKILTVSETSARAIARFFDLSRSIAVVQNGADHLQAEPLLPRDELMQRFGISKPYLLYHGGYDKRKQTAMLFNAFAQTNGTYELVCSGRPLFQSKLYDEVPKQQNIVATGFITDQELRSLYYYAAGFVHLSSDEGFNIPVAEALAEGTPCLVSDIAVHRELFSNRVTFVISEDPKAIAKQMDALALQQKRTPDCLFTWSKQAKKLLEVLRAMDHTSDT